MKLIRLPDVMERTGLKTTSVYRLVKAGKFPPPVKQGTSSFWIDDEIDAYLIGLKDARHASAPGPR